MVQITRKLILEEFLALPEGDVTYELVEGQVVPKVSHKHVARREFSHLTAEAILVQVAGKLHK